MDLSQVKFQMRATGVKRENPPAEVPREAAPAPQTEEKK